MLRKKKKKFPMVAHQREKIEDLRILDQYLNLEAVFFSFSDLEDLLMLILSRSLTNSCQIQLIFFLMHAQSLCDSVNLFRSQTLADGFPQWVGFVSALSCIHLSASCLTSLHSFTLPLSNQVTQYHAGRPATLQSAHQPAACHQR